LITGDSRGRTSLRAKRDGFLSVFVIQYPHGSASNSFV